MNVKVFHSVCVCHTQGGLGTHMRNIWTGRALLMDGRQLTAVSGKNWRVSIAKLFTDVLNVPLTRACGYYIAIYTNPLYKQFYTENTCADKTVSWADICRHVSDLVAWFDVVKRIFTGPWKLTEQTYRQLSGGSDRLCWWGSLTMLKCVEIQEENLPTKGSDITAPAPLVTYSCVPDEWPLRSSTAHRQTNYEERNISCYYPSQLHSNKAEHS